MADSLRLDSVSFGYESMVEPLFENLNAHLALGWTGVVGANGAGKTTLLALLCGILRPDQGTIQRPRGCATYCEQRTDDPPDSFDAFLTSSEASAWTWRGRLDIRDDWLDRWHTLSHGERKRAQIATALWMEPIVLAVDEPTNHLDRAARKTLVQALRSFRGIGVLVSHDRELLDDLCYQCLFCDPPELTARSGGITAGLEQRAHDSESNLRERDRARAQTRRLEAEASQRREVAAKQHQMRSKRGLGKGDNDERFKRNKARYTGRDGTGGRLLKQMEGRVAQARESLDRIHVSKTHATGIWPPGSRSPKDILCALPAGSVELGESKVLQFPDLTLRRDDRVALAGPNGCGKSTFVRRLLSACGVSDDRLIYLPQEIDRARSRALLDETRRLPKEVLGRTMAVISRLNSRPERLLASESPSPGEIRKLMLALGIARSPYLIVMDEPTNHLDLPSIESLESALSECPCCLLFVSHDRRFVDALAERCWEIDETDANVFGLRERLIYSEARGNLP